MVYLLKMVIFHGKLLNNQILKHLTNLFLQILHGANVNLEIYGTNPWIRVV
jgi:hypothetical protein